MADDKSSKGTGSTPGGPAKRPYATLDLKATEIKITPVAKGTESATSKGASRTTPLSEQQVPLPAAASTYAASASTRTQSNSEARMQAEPQKSEQARSSSSATGKPADARVVVDRRGGFFSHLVAGIVGGVLSFLALQWAIPELGLETTSSRFVNDTASLSERVGALEKKVSQDASASDLSVIANRVADLEKTAQTIPALTDSQKRLIAETKAALASAASDTGSTQLIERVGKLEDKLKALADAGANDPNPTRIEQLAGLTAKVTDLETSLSTQLAALRASVTKDVDSRVQVATAASETAQAGSLRLDKDVASLKTDAARIEANVNANKDATARIAADLKTAQDQTAQVATALDALKANVAKPAEIAASVAPIAERTAALEKSIQQVVQSEGARQKTAEQVVLALQLQNLKRLIDGGQKYSTQLADIESLAGSSLDLSALKDLQNTGAPTLADLKNEFRPAANAAMDAESEAQNTGVMDRLWSEAKSVVRVRRIDLKPDDKSTEAVLGRMQVALNDGRLGDVLEMSKDLSQTAQDAARPFLDRLNARVGVDSTLAQLEAQLKSSIAPGSAPTAKSAP
ncbi:hypothetical protein HYPDE_41323 [Hyphomicrobium denitrificans 1NES1]|uniref:Uncharacterized protein n=1 Tax=Hyphomicrobium denitrificans 1NES1 TaxID=670307 RepID=N0BA88_9HYPH|nr:hypothetical protein [Hyphomicrobium denitrificans]AGK59933.1 hypothetical protein HYPDE_41323 [Hyphomicrobium denitrificans 1NES1]